MKRETVIWTIVFLLGVCGLLVRYALSSGLIANFPQSNRPFGVQYMATPQGVEGEEKPQPIAVTYKDYDPGKAGNYKISFPRTVGLWVAVFFTLSALSYVYKDNPFYRFSEAVFVGVSAAYWMVYYFWSIIVPNLLGKLWPAQIKSNLMPGLDENVQRNWWYLIPLILGIMLLWRLAPKGTWIARWPLAFIVGTFAGIRLLGFLHADFLSQIRKTILPLVVTHHRDVQLGVDEAIWASVQNILIVLGVFCGLVYFFFSIEHKGVVGKVSRFGVWVMMITFGAAFGYTVMGRIALLADRLEFLFGDWLWIL